MNVQGDYTDIGYVWNNGNSFIEHYGDRDDLPDEHKIFAYPPQEKSIKKSLANFQQMISEAPATLSPKKLTSAKTDR